ncbi:MAG: phosphatidylglycerol lysyltransferase domain-containing protein [Deltaproteobacteria bacterium]|nr:phosphatidylglycerol lysyltransferase domain-containing protein [Deltaproteobacteria bacterium]
MQNLNILTIEDKPVFDDFFRSDPPEASEYTFTNLFMWRKKYHPSWSIIDDCLIIIMNPKNEKSFGLFPIGLGDKRSALKKLKKLLIECSGQSLVSRVESRMVSRFIDDLDFEIDFDRDNSDYVYLSEHLGSLPGNRYHRKKNHLNRFKKKWDYQFLCFDEYLIDKVLQLQEDWCEFRDCNGSLDLVYEDQAVFEALNNYRILGFKGGAILIDGKVQAFSFGEMLNLQTAVIHIEKANPEIPELYTAINQMFAINVWSEIQFINREQDLGLTGLRKAKESYYPHHMVEKYILHGKG